MRYQDLKIETQRQAPSNARTEGFALLVRANFLTRDGGLTALGQQAIERLQQLSHKDGAAFFERLALPMIRSEQETFFAMPGGEVEVLECPACHYADRKELALFQKRALPAEELRPAEKVPTPECNTIEALANFLGIPKEKTAKALMFTRLKDGRFVFVVVRGDMQLSEAKLKGLVGDVRLAEPEEITHAGAAPGYASPVGLRSALIVVDDLVPQSANLAAGANEAGFHLVNTNYGRDYSAEVVADVAQAGEGSPCPKCGEGMTVTDAVVLADGNGIHFEAVLRALAEVHHDGRGLTLPFSAAPFDVYLMQVPGKELDTKAEAGKLSQAIEAAGFPVLFDDRDERAGVKFNDADLIGCPLRITVGEKNLKEGMVELKLRKDAENQLVPLDGVSESIQSLMKTKK